PPLPRRRSGPLSPPWTAGAAAPRRPLPRWRTARSISGGSTTARGWIHTPPARPGAPPVTPPAWDVPWPPGCGRNWREGTADDGTGLSGGGGPRGRGIDDPPGQGAPGPGRRGGLRRPGGG